MDAKKFGVLWYYGEMSARILNGVTAQSMYRSNSYLTIPKNDYIVAEKNFCFHRENTLREGRNNV